MVSQRKNLYARVDSIEMDLRPVQTCTKPVPATPNPTMGLHQGEEPPLVCSHRSELRLNDYDYRTSHTILW